MNAQLRWDLAVSSLNCRAVNGYLAFDNFYTQFPAIGRYKFLIIFQVTEVG